MKSLFPICRMCIIKEKSHYATAGWSSSVTVCLLMYGAKAAAPGKPCNTRLPAAGFKSSTLRTASAPYSENPRFNAPKPVRSAS